MGFILSNSNQIIQIQILSSYRVFRFDSCFGFDDVGYMLSPSMESSQMFFFSFDLIHIMATISILLIAFNRQQSTPKILSSHLHPLFFS